MKGKLFFTFLFLTRICHSQNGGTWTWIHGDSTDMGSSASIGSFGTKGVPSPTNLPPAKYQTAYWSDLNGNFWIFSGADDYTTDLWRYNPITNLWTWVSGSNNTANSNGNYGTKGIPSVNNFPAARGYGANCWTDSIGDLWLYGGAKSNSHFGDLWRYHIATNEWTWMSGESNGNTNNTNYGTKFVASVSNSPGKRYECKSGWVHNNELIMFGGQDQLTEFKNDLWKYTVSNNMWTWIGGESIGNSSGNYGTKNQPAVSNMPSGRYSYTKWKKDNFIYIFAGGISSTSSINDVWSYNLNTNIWTWIAGDNTSNSIGINPNKNCESNNTISPSSRFENQSIQNTSCSNSFWSFGGFTGQSSYNDLWLYKLELNQWVRVSGDSAINVPPIYGIKGIPNNLNKPSSRGGIAIWNDNQNRLYIFGGYSTHSGYKKNNDMWRFEPDPSCIKYNLGGGLLSRPDKYFFCKPLDTATIVINGKPDSLKITPAINFKINSDTSKIYLFPLVKTTYTILTYGTFCNEYADTTYITIDFRKKDTSSINLIECSGYIFNNNPLTNSGIYRDTLINQFGCDSLVILNFTLKTNSNYYYTKTICPGENYLGYSNAGTYTDTIKRPGRCDSVSVLKLIVTDTTTKFIYDYFCFDKSYFFNNTTITNSGQYIAKLKTVNNCDSTIVLNLVKLPPPYPTRKDLLLCYGTVFKLKKIISTDTIFDTLYNIKKCDSVYLTYYINVSNPPIKMPIQEIIFCDSIRIKYRLYTYSFSYEDTVKTNSSLKCDSIYYPFKYILKKTAPMNISASPNLDEYIIGESLTLETNFARNLFWSTGETKQKINITLYGDKTYQVIGWNDVECKDTASISLIAVEPAVLDIPKAFSPTGKIENQIFKPNFKGKIVLNQFVIFNRWGEKIFEAKNLSEGWDGSYKNQAQPAGIYSYLLEYKMNRNIYFKSGEILLVR
jgi:gliding motility-associated-like protein